MMMRSDISWLLKNIQQKILKDTAMAKLKKPKKLHPSCDPDRSNMCLFTNMSVAIAAIVKTCIRDTNLKN